MVLFMVHSDMVVVCLWLIRNDIRGTSSHCPAGLPSQLQYILIAAIGRIYSMSSVGSYIGGVGKRAFLCSLHVLPVSPRLGTLTTNIQ